MPLGALKPSLTPADKGLLCGLAVNPRYVVRGLAGLL